MPAAQAPCISSFPSRLLASTLLGYFKWCPNLPRVFVLGSALLYGLVLPTRLIAAAYLGVKLLLEAHGLHSVSGRRPKERAAADWWLNLLKTRAKALRADIFEALVFAAWAPFAPVALVLALAEAVSLLRLRLVGGDVVVRVQQNICMHGFMVMPEIVVNSILTLDALCGPRVRVRVEMGAKTMDGGKVRTRLSPPPRPPFPAGPPRLASVLPSLPRPPLLALTRPFPRSTRTFRPSEAATCGGTCSTTP